MTSTIEQFNDQVARLQLFIAAAKAMAFGGDVDVEFEGETRASLERRFRQILDDTEFDFAAANSLLLDMTNLRDQAATARVGAEDARDAALLRGVFESTADALSKGVISLASLVGGSGGTNGTFDLAFSGGAGTGAAGRFVVAGGTVVSVIITAAGRGYTSAPAVSFAASSGLTGASGTAVIANNVDVGNFFAILIAGSDDEHNWYRVDAGPVATYITSGPSSAALAVIKAMISPEEDGLSVQDPHKETGLFLDEDGVLRVSDLVVSTLNGRPITDYALTPMLPGGFFPANIIYFDNTGQSLGELSTPVEEVTTDQEYNNIGFPFSSLSPAAYLPLTTGNTQSYRGGTARGECPMYGALGFIQELVKRENARTISEQDFQLLACNNAYGGTTLAYHEKAAGQTYALAQSQIVRGKAIADSQSRTFAAGAWLWTQGEGDAGNAVAGNYKARLMQLAVDKDADAKAVTGQTNDYIGITYQVSQTTVDDVALALRDAGRESALLYTATPMYFFAYGDTIHVTADSSKWLGAYYGLVYKRVVIDQAGWQPLDVDTVTLVGARTVVLDYIGNETPILFDVDGHPAVRNYGFELVTSADAQIEIASVEITGDSQVTLIAAVDIPASSKVRYGTFDAKGGNLRDALGDSLTYNSHGRKRMDKWALLMEEAI